MDIYIPDDLAGSERRRITELYPIVYALRMFKGNKELAAQWLGISRRALFNRIIAHNELKIFTEPNKKYAEQCETKEVKKDPLARICRWHIEKAIKSFWFSQLSEKEQQETLDRIRNLYVT